MLSSGFPWKCALPLFCSDTLLLFTALLACLELGNPPRCKNERAPGCPPQASTPTASNTTMLNAPSPRSSTLTRMPSGRLWRELDIPCYPSEPLLGVRESLRIEDRVFYLNHVVPESLHRLTSTSITANSYHISRHAFAANSRHGRPQRHKDQAKGHCHRSVPLLRGSRTATCAPTLGAVGGHKLDHCSAGSMGNS
ncbi:hypothetical protein EDD37DRAFT_200893 [Exophiala viscosa]|uniref:uncharacterized protein n=1 Tax=Exophiala viscosa TaxID=2486360 RepID=UPI00218E867A|nr:hypothetical protein EDD37DRAFT_200893 [Exophiala viscosa]